MQTNLNKRTRPIRSASIAKEQLLREMIVDFVRNPFKLSKKISVKGAKKTGTMIVDFACSAP